MDPMKSPTWSALAAHRAALVPNLRSWLADPERSTRLTRTAADLHVDLSKNLVTDETVALLLRLAEEVGLAERIEAMFTGEHINVTEDRAVLHTALRRPPGQPLVVGDQDVAADVQTELVRVLEFAEQVRSGRWTGVTGQRIRTVVNIGIGGSDLGPVMAYEALRPYVAEGLEVRFVSNIDPTDIAESLAGLDPTSTLFIVASKTFGTLETLVNARLAREWLWRSLQACGAIADSDDARRQAVGRHFVAISTAAAKVSAFGIDTSFGFWDWVGGRYSVDSAIGTCLAIAIGADNFRDFLAGFHAIDEHFRTTAFADNVPVLMGLLNIWYTNFLDAHTHAVLPYAQYLHRFPAYLQQLTMESNGKSVRSDGAPVTTQTGEVFWGEPGTNGQHAFYQLIHQGTRIVPADFIAFATTVHPLRDGDTAVHELLLANFFAQTMALALGKTSDEVRAEGTAPALVPARVFSGNRPTTSIMAPALTPSVLGQLIALYEHITFVQGAVWGIDSFDQWGVELGKQLAVELTPAVAGDAAALAALDVSTRSLIEYYRAHRAT